MDQLLTGDSKYPSAINGKDLPYSEISANVERAKEKGIYSK